MKIKSHPINSEGYGSHQKRDGKLSQSTSKRATMKTADITFAELVDQEIDRLAERENLTKKYLRGEFK